MRQFFAALGRICADTVQDNNGGFSTMRLSLWLLQLAVLGAWLGGMLAEGRYIPLGPQEAWVLCGTYAAKVAQSWIEARRPASPAQVQAQAPSLRNLDIEEAA